MAQQHQSGECMASNRLVRRCRSMGLMVLSVACDGQLLLSDSPGWLERLIAESPVFAEQLRDHLPTLTDHLGQSVELWPGLWVISLPPVWDHEPTDPVKQTTSSALAILPTNLWIDGQWFALLCEQKQIDRQTAMDQIDPSVLFTTDEANRIVKLLGWMVEDEADMGRQAADLRVMGKHLGDSYEELNMLYRLSASLTVDHPEPCFLTQACQELLQVVGLRWVAVLLTDNESRLHQFSGKLYVAGQPPCENEQIQQIGQAFFTKSALTEGPMVMDDTRASDIAGLSRLANHILIMPLSFEGQTIGILLGADKLYRPQISSIDVKLFSALGHSLSFYLQNTMLYEDTHAMFMGTMHALTKLIDAKDSYTYGHTERVALLSKQFATKLGLDTQSVERVYIASLIHDVGKIGIPEAVLCKPGVLTEEEFNLIKKHPEIGARVLSDIPQMQDLIPGVLYHHERWDGNGYPHQLAGEDIPLLGRLIALADSYDAMCSNRTYRNAMKHDQALAEIRQCAGTQFDPELAKVFVSLDFSPYCELIGRHQLESHRDAA